MLKIFIWITCLLFPTLVSASDPVAIIEDINAPSLKLEMFEELEQGQRFSLKSGTITISYLKSCRREVITGGTVVIGLDSSTVTNGNLTHEIVECDGGAMNLSSAESGKSAVAVFRAPPGAEKLKRKVPKAQITLYGTSPVIKTDGSAKSLKFTRLDKSDTPKVIQITGRVTDLLTEKIELEPGGVYRAQIKNKSLIIKVDALAEPGATPIIGRLMRF